MSNSHYFKFTRHEMADFLPKTYSKVLEIGCGEGNFVQTANQSDEYWGVELDPRAAKMAEARLDKVLQGDYYSVSASIPNDYFSVLVCNDVIEHIEQYDAFLNDIKSKLRADGVLVLSIPNVRFLPNLMELLFAKDWRYRDAGILDKTHLRFFTKKSLVRALNDTGWEIEYISGINRYGNRAMSPKRLASYLGQLIFGWDTAHMQFGVRARKL